MALKMCPGCGQNIAENARRCPACGWECSTHSDIAANHFITWFTLYAIGIAIAGVIAVDRAYGQNLTDGAHNLAPILIIATLGSYVLLKVLNLRRHRKIWMASAAIGVLLTAGVYATRVLMAQDALPMVSLWLHSSQDDGSAPSTTQPVGTQPTGAIALSAPDFAPLMPVAKKAFAVVRQQPFALRAELDAAGVPRMLTPVSLLDARRVSASRARITRLYARLDDFKSAIHQSIRDAIADARSTDALDQAKARFLQDFQNVSAGAEKSAADFTELERRLLQQTDDVLKLAQQSSTRGAIKNGVLVFSDRQEQEYESLLRQLASTQTHQQELLRGFLGSNDPSMQRLASALSRPARKPAAGAGARRSAEASVAE